MKSERDGEPVHSYIYRPQYRRVLDDSGPWVFWLVLTNIIRKIDEIDLIIYQSFKLKKNSKYLLVPVSQI